MSEELTHWELQPQEQEGEYMFSGMQFMTKGISESLHPIQVVDIILKVRERVEKSNGADYLQVFTDKSGRKIYVIDQLNRKMKADNPKEWVEVNDMFTIMFSYEY